MENKLIIIGCGGHARSVADVFLQKNTEAKIIFVDKNAKKNETILNFPVLKEFSYKNEPVFVAYGDNKLRREETKKYTNIQTIISEKAYVGKNVSIGKGAFIAHFAHIGVNTQIGENTIINTAAIIDHEVIIGKNSHLAPNCTVCGRTKIGDNVFVGAGAVIIEGLKISNNVIIGAGSVVIKNIDEEGTYAGNPLRKIK